MAANKIHLVECPRDAMQGWKRIIPTKQKIAYIQSLLKVNFITLDCGSFVSPKAIPQMADTQQVLDALILDETSTRLLVIVANVRGAIEAVSNEKVGYIGFPFSISPTFQQRNTNSTIQESFERVEAIQQLCVKHNKLLVIYLSMGFGNPYGDAYNEEILMYWADRMAQLGVQIISLADTVGVATPQQISTALNTLLPQYNNIDFGVHLHSTPENWQPKLDAAVQAGCTRFDGALKGIGGCPMAKDELVGNMDTLLMIDYFREISQVDINETALQQSLQIADFIFTA